MKKAFSLIFLFLLLVPAAVWLVGLDSGPTAKGKKPNPPRPYGNALLSVDYYRSFDQYVNRNFSLRRPLTVAKNWLDYHIFRTTDATGVHIGRSGWLYSRKAIDDYRKEACKDAADMGRMFLELQALERIIEASGRRFLFIVAPDKTTVYPEYVDFISDTTQCSLNRYDLLLKNIAEYPLGSFVRLDEELRNAKERGALLYDKTSTCWNGLGAVVAAETILGRIFDGFSDERPSDYHSSSVAGTGDLYNQLMGSPASTEEVTLKSFENPHRPDLPTGFIYGDAFVENLLPNMAHMFKRLDVIFADRIPSRQHGEDLQHYDFILLERAESELATVHVDLDKIFSSLESTAQIPERHPLDLRAAVPISHISLDLRKDALQIKSMGPHSAFKLTSVPGSDKNTFRVLKLSVAASQLNIMTITSLTGTPYSIPKSLRPGTTDLYLPLPFQKALSFRIQPGNRAGLFVLRSAEIFGFIKHQSIQEPPPGTITVAKTDQQNEPASLSPGSTTSISESEPGDHISAAVTDGEVSDSDSEMVSSGDTEVSSSREPSIAVADFEDGRIFQRKGTSTDITVSGTYTGTPKAIEARVISEGTLEEIVPWTVIDASLKNGLFLGLLPDVPQGGWYNIQVRHSTNHPVSSYGSHKWGIGILVACLGQSNMKEWFYKGTTLRAHSLLRKFTVEGWAELGSMGNGAIAFGNRIIERLGIPVGMLDYSENGSGLRKEADFGTGYWEDTSVGSIYNRFVSGVSEIGDAVEFVIWIQGEADAARGTVTEGEYTKSLESFITNQIRADIRNGSHHEYLPFLIVTMVKRPGGKDKPNQAIRNAQRHVTENVADCYLAATTLDLENQGRQHLAPDGFTPMGGRVAQTVLYILGEEKYYRGPEVAGVKLIDDRTIDVRLNHRGGTDFTPDSGISGWEILMNGARVPIAEVYRHNPRTIKIMLKKPLTGKATIRYLYGAMPDASNPVLDNSAMRLPLEEYQSEIQ